jgi:hypothetical protein
MEEGFRREDHEFVLLLRILLNPDGYETSFSAGARLENERCGIEDNCSI